MCFGIIIFRNNRKILMCPSVGYMINESFILQDPYNCTDSIIGRLWLIKVLKNFFDKTFFYFPEDLHHSSSALVNSLISSYFKSKVICAIISPDQIYNE